MEIPKELKDEIWEYCRVNDIPNIDQFNLKLLQVGFTAEKYGELPIERKVEVKEVEVVKEVVKEVPVEVVKEIEVVKEVVKEVFITNDEEVTKLVGKIETIQNEHEEEKKVLKQTITNFEDKHKEYQTKIARLNGEIENLTQTIKKLQKGRDFYGE